MKRVALALVLACGVLAPPAPARQPPTVETGSTEELRGVNSIYLDIRSGHERKEIVNQIRKKLPHLKIADGPEEAEVWLRFRADVLSYPGNSARAIGGAAFENYEVAATGAVLKPLGKGRVRVLLSFDAAEKSIVYPRLGARFAGKFIKAYQKANGAAERR